MNIVVICGSYLPTPSAVGMCAKNIVDELTSRGHKVFVVAMKNDAKPPSDLAETIVPITSRIHNLTLGRNKFRYFLHRIIRYAQAIFKSVNVKDDIVESYIEALQYIDNKYAIDLIIPFCFPIEGVIAALQYNKSTASDTSVYPVVFDNFAESETLHRLKINKNCKRKRHLRIINNIITKATCCYITNAQKDFYKKYFPEKYEQIIFIEHPLLSRPKTQITQGYKLIYSGSFLKRYVPSADVVSVLRKVVEYMHIEIEFCVMGDDVGHIHQFEKDYPQYVINNGTVPFNLAKDKIAGAGILLSVGEINGIQISSKIFTYMSMGKPIIHFYYIDSDINVSILKRYPLFYAYKVGDTNNDIKDLCEFIEATNGRSISYEQVISIYPEALPITFVNKLIGNMHQSK